MHILLTDETNRRPSGAAKFFIYGGLAFDAAKLADLTGGVEAIRKVASYQPGDELKFDTNARPQHVSFEAATSAKKAVVDLCGQLGCKFIVHIILHEIIKNQDPDQHIYWAADYVIGRFNRYLDEVVNDDGICIVDNLPVNASYKYLTEKHTKGLSLPGGKTLPLNRVKMFATTCLGASHANSAVDIVLGTFRYCINDPKNVDAAQDMMGAVTSLLWHRREGETIHAIDYGLIVRPRIDDIRVEKYKREYDSLFEHINSLIRDR